MQNVKTRRDWGRGVVCGNSVYFMIIFSVNKNCKRSILIKKIFLEDIKTDTIIHDRVDYFSPFTVYYHRIKIRSALYVFIIETNEYYIIHLLP